MKIPEATITWYEKKYKMRITINNEVGNSMVLMSPDRPCVVATLVAEHISSMNMWGKIERLG